MRVADGRRKVVLAGRESYSNGVGGLYGYAM